jgi:hypothetical protein
MACSDLAQTCAVGLAPARRWLSSWRELWLVLPLRTWVLGLIDLVDLGVV